MNRGEKKNKQRRGKKNTQILRDIIILNIFEASLSEDTVCIHIVKEN